MSLTNLKTIHQKFYISPDESGQRLDLVLVNRFGRFSRKSWQDRILDSQVQVNGRKTRSSRKMNPGDEVSYQFDEMPEPDVATNYTILFENSELLIIDKPANLPVHPSGIYNRNTLLGLLRLERGEQFVAYFANRLDRETSGVIALAKTPTAAKALVAALNKNTDTGLQHDVVRPLKKNHWGGKPPREIGLDDLQSGPSSPGYGIPQRLPLKEYLVWVEGDFPEQYDANGFLGKHGNSKVHKKMFFDHESFEGAQSSRTFFTEVYTGRDTIGEISMLRAFLFTGRTHQIRATLCSLGFPVIGDRLYGFDETNYLRFIADDERADDLRRLRLNRTALHAHRLKFYWQKEVLEFIAPLPADLQLLNSEKGIQFDENRKS